MTVMVFVRDIVNRRVHKRYRNDGERALYAMEPEAPDSSGAYEVMTDAEIEAIEPGDLCRICFGEIEGLTA